MQKKPYFLFDFDGTLVSTEEIAVRILDQELRRLGLEQVAPTASRAIVGRTWASAFQLIRHFFPDQSDSVSARVQAQYQEVIQGGAPWIEGALDFIREIKRQGFPLALVTGSSRREVDAILSPVGAHALFDVILTSETYERSKPHPDPYRKALEFYRALPEDALVFEDSVAGMDSARAVGAPFIQVRGHGLPDAKDALLTVSNYRDLMLESVLKIWATPK